MEQGSFAGGVKDGVWVSYHADGARSSEGKMIDGKQHGEWSYWSSDGQSRTVGQWKLGNKDGVWREMNAEDRAVAERLYRDGRLVSQKDL
jgi:antitoxin component YwqK of YwqJK toxin-antitoxin module